MYSKQKSNDSYITALNAPQRELAVKALNDVFSSQSKSDNLHDIYAPADAPIQSQHFGSAEELCFAAHMASPSAKSYAQNIVNYLNRGLDADIYLVEGRIKSVDSIQKKLPEYGGDLRRVLDSYAHTIVYEDNNTEQLANLVNIFRQSNNGYTVRFKDDLSEHAEHQKMHMDYTGYRALKINLKDPETSLIHEIQIVPESMWNSYKETHSIFKEIKQLKDKLKDVLYPSEADSKALKDRQDHVRSVNAKAANDGGLKGLTLKSVMAKHAGDLLDIRPLQIQAEIQASNLAASLANQPKRLVLVN